MCLRVQREAGSRFPVACVHHLDRIPRTAFKKSSVGTFARAELAADAQVGIDFDEAVWKVVRIRDPEHALIDRAVLDARR